MTELDDYSEIFPPGLERMRHSDISSLRISSARQEKTMTGVFDPPLIEPQLVLEVQRQGSLLGALERVRYPAIPVAVDR